MVLARRYIRREEVSRLGLALLLGLSCPSALLAQTAALKATVPPAAEQHWPAAGQCFNVRGELICVPQPVRAAKAIDNSVCGQINKATMCVPPQAAARLPQAGDCSKIDGKVYCLPQMGREMTDEERQAVVMPYFTK